MNYTSARLALVLPLAFLAGVGVGRWSWVPQEKEPPPPYQPNGRTSIWVSQIAWKYGEETQHNYVIRMGDSLEAVRKAIEHDLATQYPGSKILSYKSSAIKPEMIEAVAKGRGVDPQSP